MVLGVENVMCYGMLDVCEFKVSSFIVLLVWVIMDLIFDV
jgi:hypothetical protein